MSEYKAHTTGGKSAAAPSKKSTLVGDSDSDSDGNSDSDGGAEHFGRKVGKAAAKKPAAKRAPAKGKKMEALFNVEWHRVILGEWVFVLVEIWSDTDMPIKTKPTSSKTGVRKRPRRVGR
jgi:hypothetical protein